MKTFICWAGSQSKHIALALREWLPNVIQGIKPWMSEEDITKGAKWAGELGTELSLTNFGIVCLTPENRNNPWIHFEAGALSKQVKDSYVIPYLQGVSPSEITGPLASFQMAEATEADTYKLLSALNQAQGENALSVARLKSSFDKWWPELQEQLVVIPSNQKSVEENIQRADRDILDEILSRIRELPRDVSRVGGKEAFKFYNWASAPRRQNVLLLAEELYQKYLDILNMIDSKIELNRVGVPEFYALVDVLDAKSLESLQFYMSAIRSLGNYEQRITVAKTFDNFARGNIPATEVVTVLEDVLS